MQAREGVFVSQEQRIIPNLRLVETPSQTPLERCLEMFLLDQEARRHTPRTIKTYRETLTPFLEYLAEDGIAAPEEITPHAIRRFLVSLERRGLKDNTIVKYARCIQTFCNFLASEDLIDASPMRKVAMPKPEKKVLPPFSREEVEKLLAACGKDLWGLRDRAMILCLLDTGLRASEFVAMNVGDVSSKDGMVKVYGKGKKERFVRLGAQSRKAVLRYLAERGETQPGDPLWVGRKGRLTTSGLFQAMKRLGKRAGVWPVGPHRFRRTFAVWCLRGGMDPYSLKALMGHADLQMVQQYLKLVREDVEAAHKQASPVDRLLSKRR